MMGLSVIRHPFDCQRRDRFKRQVEKATLAPAERAGGGPLPEKTFIGRGLDRLRASLAVFGINRLLNAFKPAKKLIHITPSSSISAPSQSFPISAMTVRAAVSSS